MDNIAAQFNLTWDNNYGVYYGICDNMNNMVNFSIDFGNNMILVFDTSNQFNGGPYTTDMDNNTLCYVQMSPYYYDPPLWIIGSLFLRQYYSIFDFTTLAPTLNSTLQGFGQVGFASRIPNITSDGNVTTTTSSSTTTLATTTIMSPTTASPASKSAFPIVSDSLSFGIGILVGIGGATLILGVLYRFYYIKGSRSLVPLQ